MDESDVRVTAPIFTPLQLARLVDMPVSTVYSWTRPTGTRPALIHRVEAERRGWPTIPLLGAAEAAVLRPLRVAKMPMREIAAAVAFIREQHGPFALGSPGLVHDGAVALRRGEGGLERLRDGQGVLPGLLQDADLRPFRLAPDGFVEALTVDLLPGTEIDPRFSSGRMRFTKTGVPVFAVAGLLAAGEPAEVVAREYGVELTLVRAVERADPAWVAEVA